MITTLKIGTLVIPVTASISISQSYETIGGVSRLRMMSGAGIAQKHWTRLRTSISGSGIMPEGLADLDPALSYSVACVARRAVSSSTNSITLPATRRTDTGYEPRGMALVGNGLVPTALTLAGNVATLTPVSGAVQYRVEYYPQFVAFCDVSGSTDARAADYGWTIVAEEV